MPIAGPSQIARMTLRGSRRVRALIPALDRVASPRNVLRWAPAFLRESAMRRVPLFVIIAVLVVALGGSVLAVPGTIILASTSDANVKGNDASEYPALSADGTRVAFDSLATNLDPGAFP